MRRIALSLLAVAGFAAAVSFAVWLWGFWGSLKGKATFAALQGLELAYRHEHLPTPQVFGRYTKTGPVIVISTFDKRFPYAWIAATISSCDGELCMVGGDARLDLNCSDVARLETQIILAQPVKVLLRNACRDR